MKIYGAVSIMICLASFALAGSRAGPPAKAPGGKTEAVRINGLVLKATAEFWEDRMPVVPVPKTPEDNAGRFHVTAKVSAANEGRKVVSNLSVSEIIVYYGGTTREFCRIKPALVGETRGSASVAPGNQVTLEYSGLPEKIGSLKDSMAVYGQMVVTYGKGKRTSVLTPEAKVLITQ